MKNRSLLLGLGTAIALLTTPLIGTGCASSKASKKDPQSMPEGRCGKKGKEGKCGKCGKCGKKSPKGKEGKCGKCGKKTKSEGSCGEGSCGG
ncbi:MAG: hypothetical protein AAF320_01055 [Myxococcota bacterium]